MSQFLLKKVRSGIHQMDTTVRESMERITHVLVRKDAHALVWAIVRVRRVMQRITIFFRWSRG